MVPQMGPVLNINDKNKLQDSVKMSLLYNNMMHFDIFKVLNLLQRLVRPWENLLMSRFKTITKLKLIKKKINVSVICSYYV